jgi:aspartate/tyrosine/aromatic aminotransferase
MAQHSGKFVTVRYSPIQIDTLNDILDDYISSVGRLGMAQMDVKE